MHQTVLADMLFKGDKFRVPGEAWWQTATDEPTIYPVKKQVEITARSKNGQTVKRRFRLGATVEIWSEAR